MVTEVPTGAEAGVMLVMLGATPKFAALLATLFTVTTTLTFPDARLGTVTTREVLLQETTLALVPAKVTVLVP